jgi:hypothetical protein
MMLLAFAGAFTDHTIGTHTSMGPAREHAAITITIMGFLLHE